MTPADSPSSTTSLTTPDQQSEQSARFETTSKLERPVATFAGTWGLRRLTHVLANVATVQPRLIAVVCGVLLLIGLAVGWRRMQSNPPAEDVLREQPSVARQAESANSDAAPITTTELPPLEEWLKGREVLTVSQDGRGQFQSITEAVKALQPGQVVKVLDKGPYHENVSAGLLPNDTGLVSLVGTRIDLSEYLSHDSQKLPDGRVPHLGWMLTPSDRFRLSGFDIRAGGHIPIDTAGIAVLLISPKGNLTIDHCHIGLHVDQDATPEQIRKEPWRLHSLYLLRQGISPYQVLLAENDFEGAEVLLAYVQQPVLPKTRVVFEKNSIHRTTLGLVVGIGPADYLVRHNVIQAKDSGIRFALRGKTLGQDLSDLQVTLLNNTVFSDIPVYVNCDFDRDVPDLPMASNVHIHNNLLRSEYAGRIAFDSVVREAYRQDLAAAEKTWQVSHNAYFGEPTSDRNFPAQPTDLVLPETPLPYNANPNDSEYLRIKADGPLAKSGAGGSLPNYIGALPPGPAPKAGDWLTRLRGSLASPSGELRPGSVVLRYRLAFCQTNDNRVTEIVVDSGEATNSQRSYLASSHFHLAIAHRRQGHPFEALAEYQLAVAMWAGQASF